MRATSELFNDNSSVTARSQSTYNPSSRAANSGNSRKNIDQLWHRFIAFIAGNSEPQIQQIRNGRWRVYDPKTNRSLSFASEQEVRIWLDERYSL